MNNNKHKREVLEALDDLMKPLSDKLDILDALDKDSSCSGSYDLHDQLFLLRSAHESLQKCIERSKLIVPDTACGT